MVLPESLIVKKDYNALTGREIKEYFLQEVEKLLEKVSPNVLGNHICYHDPLLVVTLNIRSVPEEENTTQNIRLEVKVPGLKGPEGAVVVGEELESSQQVYAPDIIREELAAVKAKKGAKKA